MKDRPAFHMQWISFNQKPQTVHAFENLVDKQEIVIKPFALAKVKWLIFLNDQELANYRERKQLLTTAVVGVYTM